MSLLGFLIVAVMIALPIAWLVSELHGSRPLRIVVGLLAFGVVALGVCLVTGVVMTLNYNAWYGAATGDLITTSVQQIDDGHLDRVVKVWRGLDQQYHPTYENRAEYRELVEQATVRMRGDKPIEPGSAWDASVFKPETWAGHWEDDSGYWLVINESFNTVRSGDPPTRMQFVSASPDFRVLKFKEGDQWAHTLTFKNKYEATHEWFDLAKGTIWKTDTMHRLIRPTAEQKIMIQQDGPATQPARWDTTRTSPAAGVPPLKP